MTAIVDCGEKKYSVGRHGVLHAVLPPKKRGRKPNPNKPPKIPVERGKGAKLCARRYPWDKWFATKKFTIHRGEDFNGKTYCMAQQIRNTAADPRYNRRVSISYGEDDTTLIVTVLGPLHGKRAGSGLPSGKGEKSGNRKVGPQPLARNAAAV